MIKRKLFGKVESFEVAVEMVGGPRQPVLERHAAQLVFSSAKKKKRPKKT
jgi:hypothetical protein